MKKSIAVLAAAFFATATLVPVTFAADAKKPSAEECKKDPKMKGCEEMKKDKK
jgi:hypothetical protein